MVVQVQFTETDQHLVVDFQESDSVLTVDFGEVTEVYRDGIQDYAGPYEVTPKVDSQSLPTKGKLMTNDVTINEIPVFRVSNTSGGTTVYIANEV